MNSQPYVINHSGQDIIGFNLIFFRLLYPFVYILRVYLLRVSTMCVLTVVLRVKLAEIAPFSCYHCYSSNHAGSQVQLRAGHALAFMEMQQTMPIKGKALETAAYIQVSALPLICSLFVNLGKLYNISAPHFSHLQNEDSNSIQLRGLWN